MSGPGVYKDPEVAIEDIDDLLFGTEYLETITGYVASSARDDDSPDGTTFLRRGLLLGLVTASGKYKEFDSGAADGTQLEATAMVLAENVDVSSGSDVQVTLIRAALLNQDRVFLKGAQTIAAGGDFDTANNHRLRFATK